MQVSRCGGTSSAPETRPASGSARSSLSREEERRLLRRVRGGDRKALELLVRGNLGMVYKVAKPYRNMGVSFEDLVAEGHLGLVQAARRFDPARGVKFVTFAVWWIRRGMLKALNEHSTIVRVSYHQKRKFREIRQAEQRLRHHLFREPGREEVSAGVDQSLEALERTLRFGYREISLDEPVRAEGGETRVGETLPAAAAASAEEALLRRELAGLLAQALEELSAKERDVIRDRFGLSDGSAKTLQEVGERMRVSRERVRQIERGARVRLRKALDRRLCSVRISGTGWLSARA